MLQTTATCYVAGLSSPAMNLTELRVGHLGQAGLGLFGDAGEDHRDVITRMLIAGAGNHDSIAMYFATIMGRLQSHCHLSPWRKGTRATKFYSVFMDDDRFGGQH